MDNQIIDKNDLYKRVQKELKEKGIDIKIQALEFLDTFIMGEVHDAIKEGEDGYIPFIGKFKRNDKHEKILREKGVWKKKKVVNKIVKKRGVIGTVVFPDFGKT